jgi:molybdopterin-synthase adenylyltransferase
MSLFVLPAEAAAKMKAALAERGAISMIRHAPDDLWVVTMFQDGTSGARLPVNPASSQEALRRTESTTYKGFWHRAPAEAHVLHYTLWNRPRTSISTDLLIELLPGLPRPRNDDALLVVSHCPEINDLEEGHRLEEFAGWQVTRDHAQPVALAVEPTSFGIGQLLGHWPVDVLADKAVLVVGVGSLGSAAAAALASYGVRELHLLDPDRLLWHNIVRHVLGPRDIGRYKVEALAEHLRARHDWVDVHPHVADVVRDADLVRGLLPAVDAVLCAADGIAPRRVVSHLARRAGKDAVLTSVLEDGAFGEVLRLRRAADQGCLLCRRADLYDAGSMEPERAQERGYGDGDPHRPMTAVGPDIALVGDLAAKVTVASVLERAGYADQCLPGEQLVVGLRLLHPYKAPFDVARTGDMRWHPATSPRTGCVTCSPP